MYHIVKGVFDIFPNDPELWRASHLWQFIENKIRRITSVYGYLEARTPVLEHTDLFIRGVGQGTDIVSKEMYTFEDKAGRQVSLRPEGTAALMRALLEKNLAQPGVVNKYFYIAPMFRYERQQAGRYRQHHQFGVEAVGCASPFQDAEVIDLLFSFLSGLGLKNLSLNINSLGDAHARSAYVQALKDYLRPHLSTLSEDSQRRFEINPLRILDSKDAADQAILKGAPIITEFLNAASRDHFDQVLNLLEGRQIPYVLNPNLVRGLDYYNDVVFEVSYSDLGAQNALGGGGRYDKLIEQLGGPCTPAFGFGCGLERVLQTLIKQQLPLPQTPKPTLLFAPMGQAAKIKCFELMSHLRDAQVACEMDLMDKKLKAILKLASDRQIPFVAIIGDKELESEICELKDMQTGQQATLTFDALLKRFSVCTT